MRPAIGLALLLGCVSAGCAPPDANHAPAAVVPPAAVASRPARMPMTFGAPLGGSLPASALSPEPAPVPNRDIEAPPDRISNPLAPRVEPMMLGPDRRQGMTFGGEHLRDSGLTWSILRLPFVYGDGDGHLAMIPRLAPSLGLHPAHTYSVAHHRDVMTAVALALSGAMDGRVVNIADDAPVTVFQMAELAGDPIDGSAEPMANPWAGRLDVARARALGFRATVPTVYDAAREGIL